MQDNVAVRQNVQIGTQINQSIQVLSGLKSGDVIVSAGTNKVQKGGKINAVAIETGDV